MKAAGGLKGCALQGGNAKKGDSNVHGGGGLDPFTFFNSIC